MTRHLATTRRHVPLDRVDEYLAAWAAVRDAIVAAGGRAWIFHGAEHEDQFLEFIEWSGGVKNPLAGDGVADALLELNAFATPMHAEEWEEAT